MSSVELHSGDYVARYNRKPLDRVRRLAAYMAIPDNAEIADFACGNGMLLHALGSRAGKYHGVDFSPEFVASAVEWAKREGRTNYEFHCDGITAFCAKNPERFDVAATLDFSEHVSDDEAAEIYSAIRRSLKPGGKLYLHSPNRDFLVELMKDRGVLRQFPEHIAVRNGEQTLALLQKAGFGASSIKLRHIPHYNVLKHLHALGSLPLIGRYFRARLWVEASA